MKPTHACFMPDWNGLGEDGIVDFQFAGVDYFADQEQSNIVSDARFRMHYGQLVLIVVRIAQPGWKSKVIRFDGGIDSEFIDFKDSCQAYVDDCIAKGLLKIGSAMVNISYQTEVENIIKAS